jgi:hypothetical protein
MINMLFVCSCYVIYIRVDLFFYHVLNIELIKI